MAREDFKIVKCLAPSYLQALINLKMSNYSFRKEKQAKPYKVGLKDFPVRAARM